MYRKEKPHTHINRETREIKIFLWFCNDEKKKSRTSSSIDDNYFLRKWALFFLPATVQCYPIPSFCKVRTVEEVIIMMLRNLYDEKNHEAWSIKISYFPNFFFLSHPTKLSNNFVWNVNSRFSVFSFVTKRKKC